MCKKIMSIRAYWKFTLPSVDRLVTYRLTSIRDGLQARTSFLNISRKKFSMGRRKSNKPKIEIQKEKKIIDYAFFVTGIGLYAFTYTCLEYICI